jgi:hypothetical protein
MRAIMLVSAFFLLLPAASAQAIRFVSKPAPKLQEGFRVALVPAGQ